MSKEGDKAAVFQTTKVRTKLRGDGSWLQQCREPADETKEDKPWIAEVRNSRLNGAPTSPETSPTKPTPPPPKPDTERAPTSGFLIRGIFTKLDKPAPTSNYNGFSGVNQFNKKPSEVYKKIAPHTVRPTPESKDGQLSTEEQEKRKEAASSVLKKSSVKQRSYVLSAAKKFEAKVEEPDTPSFVAKRVEIADDDESPAPAAPASTVPVTAVSSTPQAEPQKIANGSVKTAADVAVKEPVAQKVEEKKDEVSPEPEKGDPSPAPVTEKNPFENMKPGCTKVYTPLPELITECIPAVSTKPEPEDSGVSGEVDKPLVDLAPALSTPMSPTPTSPAPASVVPESPAPVSLTPLSPATEQPAPVSSTPLSPPTKQSAPVSSTPLSPTPLSPPTKQSAPVSSTPLSPTPLSPPTKQSAPVSSTPLSPTPLSPPTKQSAPVSSTPLSPTPLSPPTKQSAPVSSTPLSPTPLSPPTKQSAPVSSTPLSPTPLSPPTKQSAPVSSTPLSPTPLSPPTKQSAPVSSTPLSPTPLSPPTKQSSPVSSTPLSPPTKQSAPVSSTPLSPTPLSPPTKQSAPVSSTPLSPTPLSPPTKQSAPVSSTPLSPTPLSPPTKQSAPVSSTPLSPTPLSPSTKQSAPVSLTPLSPATEQPAPVSLSPISAVTEILVKTEPEPEPKPSSSVDTLTALSDTLISFDTSSPSFKDDEPALAAEEGGSADGRTTESGAEQEPAPELSNCVPMTDDLLVFTNGPEASAEPAPPPSPGRWSQDLLGGRDSESKPAKTSSALDFLADDVIPINTEARSLSVQREEEEQTDETAKETQSPTETVTLPTKTVIITDKSEEDGADPSSPHKTTTVPESSSADPFDPYPIGTTSPNSSSDLLQPVSDISINSVSSPSTEIKDYLEPKTDKASNALDSLADNIIPIDTDATSLSTLRPWARTQNTSTPEQSNTEESPDAEPEGQAEEQNMVIKFERKSKENDSPWDRWTSPTVYTIPTEEEEEEQQQQEEEEESPEDTQTQTFPSYTRIRESHREPEPAMDRYEPYSRTVTEDDRRVETPEPEAKKGFVYVKEYVNATELSLLNARDSTDGLDYLTPSSTSYSYGSPSSYSSSSLSSNCTYCGRLMSNDAKITIEHLNINCHPECFKCGVCGKPMGDLLDSMFLHGGQVNCESCYSKVFE
ncbi:zinc finger protein 185 isoform X1 [Acanthopagrus latus]|uniref:zinc finger protein 185 isoform X1 n=1 Tax=Acanthopagrus latus TaxID=8177 RepID=UPI00187BCEE8|nr:zinc finger protein 185 isoform X1 [Acanthopagrus latus]